MSTLTSLGEALKSERYSHRTLADGSGVVIDIERMRVLSLNASGMFVLEKIAAGATELAELRDQVIGEFAVDADEAERDLRELCRDLEVLLLRSARS